MCAAHLLGAGGGLRPILEHGGNRTENRRGGIAGQTTLIVAGRVAETVEEVARAGGRLRLARRRVAEHEGVAVVNDIELALH